MNAVDNTLVSSITLEIEGEVDALWDTIFHTLSSFIMLILKT